MGEEGGVKNPHKTGEERMHGENEAWFHSYTIPRTFWTDTTYLYPISIPHSLQPQSKIKHPEVIYGWRRKVVLTSNLDAKINRVLKVGSPIGQQTLKPRPKNQEQKECTAKTKPGFVGKQYQGHSEPTLTTLYPTHHHLTTQHSNTIRTFKQS